MKVAMYYSNSDIRIEDIPIPAVKDSEILVKVYASGVCGSDVMEWYRTNKTPLVLGHEIAGEVVETGKKVQKYKKGDRISASHHVPCNTCYYCRSGHNTVCETISKTNFVPGGFAEFVKLPSINVDRGVYPLPDEVSYEEATFIEPVACVIRGQRLARLEPGMSVLIIGSGIAGLLHIQLARLFGATNIIATDTNNFRVDMAKELGADFAMNAKEYTQNYLKGINKGLLADLVIVAAGTKEAIIQSFQSVEKGGSILFFAPSEPDMNIPLHFNNLFWKKEITLTSSYAATPADHIKALDLIHKRRINVNKMITHRLSLSQTNIGFQLVARATESIKVIIEPHRRGGKNGLGNKKQTVKNNKT